MTCGKCDIALRSSMKADGYAFDLTLRQGSRLLKISCSLSRQPASPNCHLTVPMRLTSVQSSSAPGDLQSMLGWPSSSEKSVPCLTHSRTNARSLTIAR